MKCFVSNGFGGIDDTDIDYHIAHAVIVPLPYEATTTFLSGTRRGPEAIISASRALELFDEELFFSPSKFGIVTLQPLEINARGPSLMVDIIQTHLAPIVRDKKFIVSLGGEHTVTIGCVQAFVENSDEPFSVLQIDAHADLRDHYQQSRFSHACVMRRIIEKCPITQVGIRSFSEEEYHFMKQNKLKPFTMRRILTEPTWIDDVVRELREQVYITIDLDGLDPAICPGVGTPEPGGLGWVEMQSLLTSVFANHEVIGADIVECVPLAGNNITEFLAARLVYKMIGYCALRKNWQAFKKNTNP